MIIVFECYSAGMNLSNVIPTGVSSISFVCNGLIESSGLFPISLQILLLIKSPVVSGVFWTTDCDIALL